jgi:hypothetical protein
MDNIKIINTDKDCLNKLYKHLSVQSLLDIKAVNGEVNIDVLISLKNRSSVCKTVLFNNKVAYTVFVIPTAENENSIYLLSSTIGYSDTEELRSSFQNIINDLPNENFYSIVYKGNSKYAKLLKDNGFRFIRNLIHGVEERNFLLLGKNNGRE